MVALNFNAAGVKPNVALEPVPTGIYPVMIVRSEEKPTKSNNGSYIEFEMQIQPAPGIDPSFHGRKVFDRLNIKNPNQTAVDIAYATLSAICHVTGVLNMTDTQQLHGRPFMAVVAKLPRDDRPDQMTNEVKGYKDINGNDPGFAGTVQGGGQPQWANNQAPQPQQNQQVQQQPQQQPPQNNGQAPNWAQPQQMQQPAQQQVQQPQQQPQPGGAPSWAQPQQQ